MTRTTRILGILILALGLVALSAGLAMAYPTGWTSDSTVVASGAGTCDIASRGSDVWVTYRANDGGSKVFVKKSTDKAVTWGSPVLVESANSDSPQICVTSTGTLYLGYWTDVGLKVKRSQDGGTVWTDYANVNNSTISNFSMTHSGDAPAITWEMPNPASGYDDAYYALVGTGGTLAGIRASHNDNQNANEDPSIATDGNGTYFVTYWTIDHVESEDDGVWVTRVTPGGTYFDQIFSGFAPYAYPSASYHGVAEQFDVAYIRENGGNKSIYSRSWTGTSWGVALNLCSAGTTSTYPRCVPYDGGDAVTRAAGGNDVVLATATSTDPVLMQAASPAGNSRAVAVATETGGTELYVACVTTGGAVIVKRTDLTDPSASGVQVTGNTVSGTTYIRANSTVTATGVVDDWNLTSTDPTGDAYTNGVSSVALTYAGSPTASTWADLPLAGQPDSTLDNAPWTATADISDISDGTLYVKATATDTSGRTGEIVSGPVVLDREAPTVTATVDTSEGTGGWRNKPTHVTISGSDLYFDRCEYKVDSGSWTPYASPVIAPEGVSTIYYRSIDLAGNYSATGNLYLQVDTTPPTISITHPATDTVTASTDGTVMLAANGPDAASGTTWMGMYVNGNKIQESSGDGIAYNWNTTGLADGNYTLEVKAKDRVGNQSTATKRFNLISKATAYFDSYFAEGCTRDGFGEYLCVLNPNDQTANLDINCQLENGEVKTKKIAVPGTTRTTINVADIVGRGHDVSTKIHADQVVVCERPMYFNQHGWTGGHIALARNTLQQEFYFAEGCTRDGFETWLTLQNPGDQQATATATYMLGSGQNVTRQYAVPAHTRVTVPVNGEVGAGQDVSIRLTSNKPIAAERPMYFNHHGWTGGHDVIGATSPQTTWYFAEGTTRDGFEEWLCIQNPGDGTAQVQISYSTGKKKTYPVAAHSRFTVSVNADVGAGKDVATTVTSNLPVIVERPMYFSYNGLTGGSDVLGANPPPQTTTTYYLAEGTTRSGFDEYITIANLYPNVAPKIYIDYVFADGSEVHKSTPNGSPFWTVAGGSRWTFNVAEDVGRNKDVSVKIHSEYPIVVERPMYFNYNGWTGGHCGVPFVSQ